MFTNENKNTFLILTFIYLSIGLVDSTTNLTCYQCVRTTNTHCSEEELLPCPSSSDRCVTHIQKDETDGFKIKRECGLGPCSFNDLMVSKGLGLDTCDRSRKEYFCIFCCRESGCNKDSSANLIPPGFLLFVTIILSLRNITHIFNKVTSF